MMHLNLGYIQKIHIHHIAKMISREHSTSIKITYDSYNGHKHHLIELILRNELLKNIGIKENVSIQILLSPKQKQMDIIAIINDTDNQIPN